MLTRFFVVFSAIFSGLFAALILISYQVLNPTIAPPHLDHNEVTIPLIRDITVRNNYAYVIIGDSPDHSSFAILDVSDPFSPTLVSQIPGMTYLNFDHAHIIIENGYAYVNSELGLKVIDISNPFSPTIVATSTIGSVDLAIGDALLVEAGVEDMSIIDISIPTSPTLLSSYPRPHGGTIRLVAAKDNLAMFADVDDQYVENGGLHLLDISNPISPTEIGFYHTTDPDDLEVFGNYAFVGSYGAVYIIDIITPNIPTLTARYQVPGFDSGSPAIPRIAIAVSRNYAYVAYGAVLYMVDISNPSQPEMLSSMELSTRIENLAIGGEYVYVIDANGGLHVFHIPYQMFLPIIKLWGGFCWHHKYFTVGLWY